ncbi:DUF2442 domain-containing protein [Deinococcus sp. QL22]|uniref:DUF2442 domain-containing protein n=1 Tax=Deinococcus sp. QL22 TaxID=2939437 RepID=UPI0020171725|nr:DUF2442 domain-containing protein [Deinococcus sp. QL22]UQN08447.1 DUF2442 domain-containing protein [Deinococcus sp. QL22]
MLGADPVAVPDGFGVVPSHPVPNTVSEVLPEPGRAQVWVTFDERETHLLDLTGLLKHEKFQALRLRELFRAVQVAPDRQSICWPAGVRLGPQELTGSAAEWSGVVTLGTVLPTSRYRPLLPYLRYQPQKGYLPPYPAEALVVQRLLQLKPGELRDSLKALHAPEEIALARLSDLGAFLSQLFAPEHLYALLRRPWHYGAQQCPDQVLLHTMLGCLMRGRPDLIERPCMLIATGGE